MKKAALGRKQRDRSLLGTRHAPRRMHNKDFSPQDDALGIKANFAFIERLPKKLRTTMHRLVSRALKQGENAADFFLDKIRNMNHFIARKCKKCSVTNVVTFMTRSRQQFSVAF